MTEAARDPSGVVEAMLRHLGAREWDAAAGLFAPSFLERFRTMDSPHLRPHHRATVEDHLARDPEMPRTVAEYFVAQARKHPPVVLGDFFAGVSSESELDSMGARELYARHLEARDPSTRLARHLAALQERYPEYIEQLEAMRQHPASHWDHPVIGAVAGGQWAFVLVARGPLRSAEEVPFPPDPEVVTLRPTEEGWRIANDLGLHRNVGFGPVQVRGDDGQVISLTLW